MTVEEYTSEFNNLSIRVGLAESNEQITSRYLAGLNHSIRDEMGVVRLYNIEDARQYALSAEKRVLRYGARKPLYGTHWQNNSETRLWQWWLIVIIGQKCAEMWRVIPQAEFAYNNSVNRSIKKTPFEAAYGLKPQHVLDLVPLPQEARVSNEGELFADHIRKIHEEVKAALKASNAEYSFTANQHRRKQEFEEGDQVLVHLRQERFPKVTT
ncbi:Uncharacterized protein TCM_041281 [Theobroma cacao]|uniref:Retrotransposon gag domain-containing protein n=1 Tax=Theobroma cacao TaxID=3641 RepID=A0A061F9J6_THECC|nr:Uncharacterized protein TCM_032307 [Theobroma cacao]EOY33324.1 Uncharacterized protein TCM_041281 [Theobroma cacao]